MVAMGATGMTAGCDRGGGSSGSSGGTARPDAGPRDAGARRSLPQLQVRFDGPPAACIPVGFRAARVRLRDDAAELCGVTRAGRPRCYRFDPVANTVLRAEVDDAPREAPDRPLLEEPVRFTEISTRGARASTRGGNLTVVGPSGTSRTVSAQQLALRGIDRAALVPLGAGSFVGIIGTHPDDLGAHAVVDPATQQVIVHAAHLRCPAAEE